jgi:hypothetical protein
MYMQAVLSCPLQPSHLSVRTKVGIASLLENHRVNAESPEGATTTAGNRVMSFVVVMCELTRRNLPMRQRAECAARFVSAFAAASSPA